MKFVDDEKKRLIEDIIAIEWDLFQNVNGNTSKASCQLDKRGFHLYRFSNYAVWTIAILETYKIYILDSIKDGRNILTEKYAYMMEETDPEKWESISIYLRKISEDEVNIIDKIWKINRVWASSLQARFPNLISLGRPMESEKGKSQITSAENYFKCELKTYNLEILTKLFNWYRKNFDEGKSLLEENYKIMMSLQGFTSLEEAEDRARIQLKDIK